MSKSIELYNGLNGTIASREELQNIISIATKEEQTPIVNKLQSLLDNYDSKKFDITLKENALEIVPASMLNGLDFDEYNEIESNGLAKAVSPNEIYQSVTNIIINTIKEVGYLPWQKEWQGTGLPTARNYVTEKPYTGINAMILPYEEKEVNGKMVIVEPKSKDIYYLTFNQIEKLGAKLKLGSKGRMVTYFNFVYNYENIAKNIKITTTSATDLANFVKKNKLNKEEVEAHLFTFPVLKYYRVFKAEDCDNLPAKEPKKVNATPNEIAEKIIELYPNSPKIYLGKDERAFYRPATDEVYMPKVTAFNEESFYYCTFFHELIHSTGHPKRLDRNMSGSKGGSDYAFEELIAELGAVYLCAESGILFRTLENSAKYLRGWNSKLVGKLQEDNKFFFKASASAQKASNYILDLNDNGEPAYRKFFDVKEETKPNKKKNAQTRTKPKNKASEVSKKDKQVNKPASKDVSKSIDKKTDSKYKVGDSVFWENKEVKISKSILIGKELKFELNLGKNKTIWTDANTLDSEAKKHSQDKEKFKKIVSKEKSNSLEKLKDRKTKRISKKQPEPKADENGQFGLFGAKQKKGLSEPVTKLENDIYLVDVKANSSEEWADKVVEEFINIIENEPKPMVQKFAKAGSKAKSIRNIGKTKNEFFTVNGEVGKFLQAVEKKPFQSVVITMDGEQGAGKTTTLYKFMDAFASAGNSSLFISGEEHPESSLAVEKRNEYLSEEALNNIAIIGEVENIEELYSEIEHYDIIFIDSWQKLQRMVGNIRLDEDLRKKFDGKVFVVIFQQTTTGRTKGGAEVVFDGDIIIKMVKENCFADNYAYFDKNRYTKVPIETIRYNIASGTVYNPLQAESKTEEIATEPVAEEELIELSFEVN